MYKIQMSQKSITQYHDSYMSKLNIFGILQLFYEQTKILLKTKYN
jgi:hypothetical protein